jgi:ArsR family transcriptional regulator, arsenate/arsenite/antimonite-responsive transcriptional repressor / arsenate reductase (thioredoxin)
MQPADHSPDPDRMVEQLAALAQGSRLAVMRLLARYRPFGLPAGDIARLVAVPHNTMSTHLALLEKAGLLRSRRDGRQIIFAVDPSSCATLIQSLTSAFAVSQNDMASTSFVPVMRQPPIPKRPYRVLVLCTANSARSLMAEALINREGRGRFVAVSAGSRPANAPHPAALRLLGELGYETVGLRSKDWMAFSAADSAPFDFAVTVCDAAQGEDCPAWPGHPLSVHWGIADPAAVPEPEQRAAMLDAYRQLAARVTSLVNLPVETMDLASLKTSLAGIARLEGATPLALQRAA